MRLRLAMLGGLSETSASLNEGGCGSGSASKACRSRGAGLAEPAQWLVLGGSGFGPPLWGASQVSQRKKGWAAGARRLMKSTALAV